MNPELLYNSLEKVKHFQEAELSLLVKYVYDNSDWYKSVMLEKGIQPDSIKTLEDLKKFPFTTKENIQMHNQKFVCVPAEKIIDYVTTSGTMGDPVTLVLTEHDLERLATNEAHSFAITGGSEKEIYQLMTTIDRRFMAGLAYFLGARKLGAGIIRVGNGIPELQWDTIKRAKPTALICVPSFLLKLIEWAEQHGIDYKNSGIKKAICIGEPIRSDDFTLNTLGKKITDKWPLQLFSTYASSEMGAAFTECAEGKGGHHQPNMVIIEVVDENGNDVIPGEAGELVVTTLSLEGMPLIRFKTGDICRIHSEVCKCGRTSARLSPILGRKNQMLKFKGTTLYPSAFYEVLDHLDEVKNYQVEVFTNEIGTDDILVRVGTTQPTEALEKEIKDHFRAKLRVAPAIKFESVENLSKLLLPETSRKPIKFIDNRK